MNTPNMVVAMASDTKEAIGLFKAAMDYKGPFAIRFPRDYLPIMQADNSVLQIGTWKHVAKGHDNRVAIISYGPIIKQISGLLKESNIEVTIANAIFQKPIDTKVLSGLLSYETIIIHDAYATKHGFVNNVKSTLSDMNYQGRVIDAAIKDEFIKQATIKEQMQYCQVDEVSIVNLIKEHIQ
jgi:1-deoxy-D-xylulose-5-phosphate synthase